MISLVPMNYYEFSKSLTKSGVTVQILHDILSKKNNGKPQPFVEVVSRITDTDCYPSECLFCNTFFLPGAFINNKTMELFDFDNDK